MTEFMWVILAVAAIMCLAGIAETNRYFKVEGFKLNLFKAGFATLCALPFFPIFYLPEDNQFYFIAVTHGLMSVYAMNVFIDLAKRYETRVSTMYLGITAVSAFVLWFVLKPEALSVFLENDINAIGISLCLMGIIIALQFLRDNDPSVSAFKALLPLGLLFGFVEVAIKSSIENQYPVIGTTLTFVAVSMAVNAVFSFVYMKRAELEISYDRSTIIHGALLGVFGFGALIASTIAIILAPNPAYPGVITMNLPVMLWIYHRLIGVKDNTNPILAFLMILGTGTLIYLVT